MPATYTASWSRTKAVSQGSAAGHATRIRRRDQGTLCAWPSSVELPVMLTTDRRLEGRRRAAWEGLPGLRARAVRPVARLPRPGAQADHRLGRLLGGVDFYDATVRRTEGLTKAEIFACARRTGGQDLRPHPRLIARAGRSEGGRCPSTVEPAIRRVRGRHRSQRSLHFPFGASLARWGRSFGALGIGLSRRGAGPRPRRQEREVRERVHARAGAGVA